MLPCFLEGDGALVLQGQSGSQVLERVSVLLEEWQSREDEEELCAFSVDVEGVKRLRGEGRKIA